MHSDPMHEDLHITLEEMRGCTRCDLSVGRTQVVLPQGDPTSGVLLIGHAPSGSDDTSGAPYSGPAGEVLVELLERVGLLRGQVWITNLTKCWPWQATPGGRINRVPRAGEIKTCTALWLRRELELLQPRALVCLGGPTAQHFLGRDFKITASRGVWQPLPASSPYREVLTREVQVMAILQPAYLIHLGEHAPEAYPAALEALVQDLRAVRHLLERGPSAG